MEAFSRDLTINLSPPCRAFSRALKTEKLKAPLFPGPVGAGSTNDWCISSEKEIHWKFKITYDINIPDSVLPSGHFVFSNSIVRFLFASAEQHLNLHNSKLPFTIYNVPLV